MTLPDVQLCSVPADYGYGANDGAYYPVGLLTIAGYLRRVYPTINVSVIDLHHEPDFAPTAPIVGISASSALNYKNVLTLAARAKEQGATVVLGGAHATQLAGQILENREDLVDYVVRGHGERAMAALLSSINGISRLDEVPGLSWRKQNAIVHNPVDNHIWRYDDSLPDLSALQCGVARYWETFRARIDPRVYANFVIFTHFGCGYRELMKARSPRPSQLARWCAYCSLNEALSARRGSSIIEEVTGLLTSMAVPHDADILLKCYGDNVATQHMMLAELAECIVSSETWRKYRISWTFYAQSSRISEKLITLLRRVGTKNLFIGFDSADDEIQLRNGLGTTLLSHLRAARLCSQNEIQVQAGFVLGCAGETEYSISRTLRFAERLARGGVVERINSAVLFIIPGAPAYDLLADREKWIRKLDLLPTEELQWYWVRHFCPNLGSTPSKGLEILRAAAERLNELNPGPRASMGYISQVQALGLSAASG